MKKCMSVFMGFGLSSFFQVNLMAAGTPKKFATEIERVFSIEVGFDNNDDVVFPVLGSLPSTCYKLAPSDFHVDKKRHKIYIQTQAYFQPSKTCIQVKIPFLDVIHVGALPEGRYDVVTYSNSGISESLQVEKSTTEDTDQYLYAPVDRVDITPPSVSLNSHTPQEITLSGTYPYFLSGCMRVVEVKTYETGKDVLVVLPIAQIFEDKDCRAADVDAFNRFTVRATLKSSLNDKNLIHVRTLNGSSVNQLSAAK